MVIRISDLVPSADTILKRRLIAGSPNAETSGTKAALTKDDVATEQGVPVLAELQKNYRHLALCPLMRDLEIDPETLPELFSVLKMTFTGVALMRVGTTGFDGTTIRLKRSLAQITLAA